ncbi:MAG: spermine/spermidine synthase [Anaerolineales bacterium]|nr:MAG: spermine/spermidine synthase [Anaerolineales bacterium]
MLCSHDRSPAGGDDNGESMVEQEKVVLAREITPHGEIQLQQWIETDGPGQPVYEIIFNGVFLMASYNERAGKAVATLAIDPLAGERCAMRALIGGLGMGYTLQAALDYDGIQAVDVVEIEEHIIHWDQRFFGELNNHALSDPRVRLIQMDLRDYLFQTEETYDAIILDVDNGPTWLALESNQRLYEKPSLARMKDLLTEGGVLTVWAAEKCPDFQKRLGEIFGQAEEITVQETDRRGRPADYFIYRARSLDG